MTAHRQRVLAALRHEETDRVPIDFGGGPATCIHPGAYAALREALGLGPQKAAEAPREEGQVVVPAEDVLRRFDTDLRGLRVAETRRRVSPDSYLDDWGVTWERVSGGPYINVSGPLQALSDPPASAIDQVAWPYADPSAAVAGLRERAEAIRREDDVAIVLNLPNCTFATCQALRGFGEFLEDLLVNRPFAQALLERVTDAQVSLARAALDAVGDLIDVVSFMDDLGTQRGLMLSPRLYRDVVRPHHARFVAALRAGTPATVLMHNDGAIADVLGDLIDLGVQAINPVQTSATGMEPGRLKREFGAHLSFWGGIDTHHVMPNGTPAEVADEVRRRIGDLGRGGGYVLAAVHNLMPEVPPRNIIAMFDAARSA
jgi:uroporphyrinogen decarboxylase